LRISLGMRTILDSISWALISEITFGTVDVLYSNVRNG
jgi:hypothetical protein